MTSDQAPGGGRVAPGPFGFHKTKGKQVRTNSIAYANMIKMLCEGGYTRKEIAEETGLHYHTVLGHIRALRERNCVHIDGYEVDSTGRENAATFKIGPGRNKKRKRRTGSERGKAYREKMKLLETSMRLAGTFNALKTEGNGLEVRITNPKGAQPT